MYCLTEMKPRLMRGKSAALKHIKFGAVVGPQARDKDKEVQACEKHFNYSIHGTSPRYMITHPKNQQEDQDAIALEGIDIRHPMDAQWTPNGRPNGRPMDACKKWGFRDSAFKEKVSTFDTLSFF